MTTTVAVRRIGKVEPSPAPWKMIETESEVVIRAADGMDVAAFQLDGSTDPATDRANARTMAAAAEMREGLFYLLNELKTLVSEGIPESRLEFEIDLVKRLLKKAGAI
jgi:hypothetical protein